MKIYEGGCIDTIFFYIIKKIFSTFPPHHHPPTPFSRSPLFITTTCVIVWKGGGGVAPLFISWFFSGVAAWRHARNGKKNSKWKFVERGGGFPTLDRRSRAFGVVVGGMRKGRGGGESWENDAVWQPPHLWVFRPSLMGLQPKREVEKPQGTPMFFASPLMGLQPLILRGARSNPHLAKQRTGGRGGHGGRLLRWLGGFVCPYFVGQR
nr:hypothetical protein [Morchella crassipes]